MLLIVYRVSSNHGKPKEYFSNALNQKWPILKRKHARVVWVRRWKELANVTFNLAQLSRWKNIQTLTLSDLDCVWRVMNENRSQKCPATNEKSFSSCQPFCFLYFISKKWMVTDSDPFVFRFLMNLSKKKKRHELVVFVLKVLLATVFVKFCSGDCWLLTSAKSLRCKNRREKILFVMEDKSQYLLPAREKSLNQVDQISDPLQKINFVFFYKFQKFCSQSFKLFWSTFCSSFIGKKWIEIRRAWVF